MSYHAFFSMSVGLKKPIRAPKGTKQSLIDHIVEVEQKLGLVREKFKDNPIHWEHFKRDFSKLDDKLLCETVAEHNAWVQWCYDKFAEWSKYPSALKGQKTEWVTPKDAQEFWHGLEQLEVPVEKWTREYYTNRMEHLYDVMRGRTSEGVSFDEKALTPRQAAQVINIFSTYIDAHDCRLDVPKGRDRLASSYDGGYDWCEKCGAMDPDDGQACKKRGCRLREETEE